MVNFNQSIHFLLNDREIRAEVSPGLLALDFVRNQLQLTGTKSGCKEGDCGACTVILGELDEAGGLKYRPMTSCLLPMGELAGKHLVTIEGLNMPELSTVQAAMVDCGGTQCGYCTPGFVVAMTAGLMEPKLPLNEEGMLYAISGNLCRCTGYRSIKAAGMQAIGKLADSLQGKERIQALVDAGAIPGYFADVAARLKALGESGPEPDSASMDLASERSRFVIAGGTDLYVQRGEEIPEANVSLLNTRGSVPAAVIRAERIYVDARMTFEAFADDPIIRNFLPEMHAYNQLIASWPMRTRSSIGGNICNASPIADMTCLLLALETELELLNRSGERRSVALRDFYLGYKQMDKAADEIVVELSFPVFGEATRVNWEKVSKRAWLDIATVNAACKIQVDQGVIAAAHFALGGVAATPLYLKEASAFLVGRELTVDTVRDFIRVALSEFDPISDVRGSADYKRLLARQLMLVHFTKLFPEQINEEVLHASLR